MSPNTLSLSNATLDFEFTQADGRLHLERYGLAGHSWRNPAVESGVFAVYVGARRLTVADLTLDSLTTDTATAGVQHVVAYLHGHDLQVEQHIKVYDGTALVEVWQVVRNTGAAPQEITRVDSFSLDVTPDDYALYAYRSDWGAEFQPIEQPLGGEMTLETRAGRSSKQMHPWFALTGSAGQVFSASVVWSGNWIFRFQPGDSGSYQLSGGLNDWAFSKTLRPGEAMTTPTVALVLGRDLNAVSQQYARVGRRFWYPRNDFSDKVPVEWNHWWPYEDADINDDVFARNVAQARDMGMEICTLDAGWFGPSDAGTEWYKLRGDWHLVNTERFPRGIRALSDDTHASGLRFGIWCEIEGLGVDAALQYEHPELVARRDGDRIGYVCLGNPAAQEWAFQTLSRLITEYNVDWIKLDFNLDPGAGCNRTDHGHGAGDGLYEHIRGYYQTLERVRAAYPNVILENCSSGGLRIDLGILRQTYMTFLSDPDWPVHDLQIFWGASTMLAPNVCLHWSFSEWRGANRPPQQSFNPRDSNLTLRQLDYYTRISMLGVYGLSQKLPDLPDRVRQRLIYHTDVYKSHVRRFVAEADLYRLTAQPRRDGQGERWTAFQYSLPDASEHLLFVFRLPGSESERAIRLTNLDPERLYRISGYDGEPAMQTSGRELMETGLRITTLLEEDSALLHLE